MALYKNGPAVGVTATVPAAGNPELGGTWPIGLGATTNQGFPDNCHTVIIYNTDATNTVLVGTDLSLADAGAGNPVTNGVRVPPQGTMTIAIGVLSDRVPQESGSGQTSGFVYDITAGTNIQVDITYVCSSRS